MTRRRAHPERRAIALAPTPRWLQPLCGARVDKAAAWRSGSSVFIRLVTDEGPDLIELVETPDAGLLAHRIDGRPPARRALPSLEAMGPERLASVREFYRRFVWMHAAEGEAYERHRPTDDEARCLSIARALSEVRRPDDVGSVPSAGDATALRAVDRFLDVLSGRWDRVYAAVDAGDPAPPWLTPILVGLGGDTLAMQRLAHERVGAADGDGALAILAAVAFERAGFHDAARDAYRAAIEHMVGPVRADLCVELSRQARARGRREEAIAWARQALLIPGDDDRRIERAASELIRCGALEDAFAVLRERCARDPVPPGAALGLAELLLWAGRADEARLWLARARAAGDESARALRCEGAASALEGRWSRAVERFARARVRAPEDMETATWLAEAHLRLGDPESAERLLGESRAVAQTPVHIVLGAALYDAEHVAERPEILALLEALGEPAEPWLSGAEGARGAALALLTRFGGNRGGEPLTRRVADQPGLGLEVVRLPPSDSILSSRDAASDTLKLIGTVPIPELERRFDALAERYPDSPHPLCYRGELDLWLGEYERAIERFQNALGRAQARWGHVGQAAARILRGEYAEADAVLAQCARVYAPVLGATTHVYVGEALRRRGDHRGAVRELSEAVRVKPGRAGAWMNLALARRALGDDAEAARIFHDLHERLPRLYWDAWRALGRAPRWPIPSEHMPALFEKALEMMRGNRSSHTITYFDADGVFRIARDGREHRAALARHAAFLGAGLLSRLAVGDVAEGAA